MEVIYSKGMGKRAKKRVQPILSPHLKAVVPDPATQCEDSEHDEAGNEVAVEFKCGHLDVGINLEILASQLQSAEALECRGCNKAPSGANEKKGKGKVLKKKGARCRNAGKLNALEDSSQWICLACGYVACGGTVVDNDEQSMDDVLGNGHARSHFLQRKHPFAMQCKSGTVWCFKCKAIIMDEAGILNTRLVVKGNLLHRAVEMVQFAFPREESSVMSHFDTRPEDSGANEVIASHVKRLIIRGLKNLGNTCFFNSVMQNLLALSYLRSYFFKESLLREGRITSALRKFFQEISDPTSVDANVKGRNKGGKDYNPKSLFDAICERASRFKGFQQQDSHELLRCLLDGLHVEEKIRKRVANSHLKSASDKNIGKSASDKNIGTDAKQGLDMKASEKKKKEEITETFVEQVFGGQLSSTVSCSECGHSSTVFEPFLDLSLPIPSKQCKSTLGKSNGISKGDKMYSGKKELKGRKHLVRGKRCTASSERSLKLAELKPNGGELKDSGLVCTSENDMTWLDYITGEAEVEGGQSKVHMMTASCNQSSSLLTSSLSDIDTTRDQICEPVNLPCADDALDGAAGTSVGQSSTTGELSTSAVILLPHWENKSIEANLSSVQNEQDIWEMVAGNSACSGLSVTEDTSANEDCGLADLFQEESSLDIQKTENSAVYGSGLEKVEVMENGYGEDLENDSIQEIIEEEIVPMTLEGCLAVFTKTEFLYGDNAWECDKCSRISLSESDLQPTKNQSCRKRMTSKTKNGQDDSIYEAVSSSGKLEDVGEVLSRDYPCHSESNDNQTIKGCSSTAEGQYLGKNHADLTFNLVSEMVGLDANDPGKVIPTNNGKMLNCGNGKQTKHQTEAEEKIKKPGKPVKRNAMKRLLINKVPPVLTVHLKRFAQDMRGRLSKLTGHIAFDEWLDLQPFVNSRQPCSLNYKLVGLVEHSGTMKGGHYVAYVRDYSSPNVIRTSKTDATIDNDRWYHISDSHVQKTTIENVLRSEAYLLFYERV